MSRTKQTTFLKEEPRSPRMARPPLPANPTPKASLEAWIETVYRELYGSMPVDRFLTYWWKARDFCIQIRETFPEETDDQSILQRLMNLRKKGHLNSGKRAK